MNKSNPIAKILLETGLALFDPEFEQRQKIDTKACLRILKRKFADWKLTLTDWKIIAALFSSIIMGDKYLSTADLLGVIFGSPYAILSNLPRVVRLLEAGIIEALELQDDNKVVRYRLYSNQPRKASDKQTITQVEVLDMHLCISKRSLRRILGEEEPVNTPVQPYASNEEYLRDWFEFLNFIEFRIQSLVSGCPEEHRLRLHADLRQWEENHDRRCINTKVSLPLRELAHMYQLDRMEQAMMVFVLEKTRNGEPASLGELMHIFSWLIYDEMELIDYFTSESRLVKNGLIEVVQTRAQNSHFSELRLGPGIYERITGKKDLCTNTPKVEEVLADNELLKLETPQEDFSQLILPDSIKRTLQLAMGECRSDVGGILRSWGFGARTMGVEADYCKPSRLMLFFGSPGTGKTFAARAFARELGKQLLVTDVSRMLSCWVGESEMNVSRLFSHYEQIAQSFENPPILLLNECDQFLTRRGNPDYGVDRMYNQMQNLFLEAFERFQGILIATTNLRENLDPAFSRRFHLKLEFPYPDADCRLKLWKIHIPDALPLAQDVDLQALAQEFALTGGQIAVIVKNAALEAAQSEGKNRSVTMQLLRKYIQIELSSSFSGGSKHTWGFSLPSQRMKDLETFKEAI